MTLKKLLAMDFKGITWAGNIYQKFEAMCLDVEEVMVQVNIPLSHLSNLTL